MIDKKFRRGICVFLSVAVILSGGCASTVRPVKYDPLRPQVTRAKQLMIAGDYLGAERTYRFLAERATSPERERYQISAVDALIKAGKDIEAKQYAEAIQHAYLTPAQRAHLDLIISQIDLSSGNAERALVRLERIDTKELPPAARLVYHDQRAFAYSLTGKTLESVRERIFMRSLLKDPAKRQENSIAILETLSLLPAKVLRDRQPRPPNILGGWMELARILKTTAPGSQTLDRTIQRWRQTYPSISINPTFLRTYAQRPGKAFGLPTQIALLLPQSGPYAQAGSAIREGFVAAYYEDKGVADKPRIEYYDSQSESPSKLYKKAVSDGADFIVGPLEKHHLKTLAGDSEVNVPVLALNQVPGVYKHNLYQLALSPEDEAEQAANSAWSYGHRRALLMIPDTKLGRRIAKYFIHYWRQLGGETLATKTYNPAKSDFSDPIKRLLDLHENRQHSRRPDEATSAILSSPREHRDADFIFLVGYPREARLIRPQLQFYGSRLPIFTTSHVYGGKQNPYQDADLNDIIFCDIPWLFDDARHEWESSVSPTDDAWKHYPGSYLRLVALGIDAYNVIPHLGTLRSTRYAGTTGTLLMREDNRIHRELPCAQFSNGIPRLLGFSPPRPITTPTYHENSQQHAQPYAQ